MGKGSNVAKANAARARNAKEQGKSKEEREASKAKAEKDRNAKKCLVCLQTFMISSKDKLLYDHVVANGREARQAHQRAREMLPAPQGLRPERARAHRHRRGPGRGEEEGQEEEGRGPLGLAGRGPERG